MSEPLRLRVKLWVHPETQERFLVALGMFDMNSNRVLAYAMNDDRTTELTLTDDEWNALPWFYFKEDGEAPRPENRTINLPFSKPH